MRLSLEAMYIAATGKMSEEDLKHLCVDVLPSIAQDDSQLTSQLHALREQRVEEYDGEISLKVSTETLSSIFKILEDEGSLSFTCVHEIQNSTLVSSFDIVNEEYLANVYGEYLDEVLSEISTNVEYLGRLSRYFYPEDCFIGRGPLYLSYIDSISGGAYSSDYDTLKYAYRTNEHFRDNPDFFNKTHCQCGGELVVRKKKGQYTVMSCINPYCYEKMAFCLADFARAMKIDGLGSTTFMDMTRGIALRNLEMNGSVMLDYRMLLNDESALYLGNAASLLWGDFLTAIENYTGTIKDLVVAMNLPYIASDASKILTADIVKNKNLTPDQLAIACSKSGNHDIKFVLNIWLHLDNIRYVILEMAKSINLNVVDEYLIYITGKVFLQLNDGSTMRYTKQQFEDLVNATLQKIGMSETKLKINGSMTHKCNYLIADEDSNTGSIRKAEGYGIPIVTSREFLERLGGGTL
ncbi:BRCT domain-containing protein [Lysinibacillus xylanilyticus]|uniref:hypothetical protein n=1 Tax=Lysinibacillus xylanilyticus TaxID=582475 RepID=UPI0036DCBBD9